MEKQYDGIKMEQKISLKEKTIQKLEKIDRKGMDTFIGYLESVKFFDSPGSTRYHGNYKGGLLEHCVNLYKLFRVMLKHFNIEFSDESAFICAIGHDLCKAGAYNMQGTFIKWNPAHPKGHSVLSLERIKEHLELTPEEETLIRYHMGMYGTEEFLANVNYANGEYTLKELSDKYSENKLAKLFYFCDDMVSQFVDKQV